MSEYRIVSQPSWQVQKIHNGKWVTVYYCKDRVGAKKCKESCEVQSLEWAALSDDERRRRILRNGLPAEAK